jgi:hypothetical protein
MLKLIHHIFTDRLQTIRPDPVIENGTHHKQDKDRADDVKKQEPMLELHSESFLPLPFADCATILNVLRGIVSAVTITTPGLDYTGKINKLSRQVNISFEK